MAIYRFKVGETIKVIIEALVTDINNVTGEVVKKFSGKKIYDLTDANFELAETGEIILTIGGSETNVWDEGNYIIRVRYTSGSENFVIVEFEINLER